MSYRGVQLLLCVCLVFIVYIWFCVCQICFTQRFGASFELQNYSYYPRFGVTRVSTIPHEMREHKFVWYRATSTRNRTRTCDFGDRCATFTPCCQMLVNQCWGEGLLISVVARRDYHKLLCFGLSNQVNQSVMFARICFFDDLTTFIGTKLPTWFMSFIVVEPGFDQMFTV